MNETALVIGAGFGGLAAAVRLRRRGYDVTILDKLDQPGGRAAVYHRAGFTFDAGPTVVTAPFLFDELFALFGKRREDYVTFSEVYPWYRIQFEDQSTFDYGGTLEQTLSEIRRIEPADADGYLRLLEHTRRIFDVGFTKLGDKPFDNILSMIKVAPQMARLGSWRTVWQLASRYIKNDKLRRVFSFQPLLVGGNPFNTTSIYSLIQFLERQWGVHFAMGGTAAIVAGIVKLLKEEGVLFRLSREVNRIEIDPSTRSVTGVRLATGEYIPAELIVCNGDAPFVHKHLIAPEFRKRWTDARIDRLKYSMGLFVLYFGTNKSYPELAHHTILLGRQYRELLVDMFDRKVLATSDFSIYLHAPTRTDPTMSPPGCEAFYALCPVPNLQGNTDWTTMGPRYRDLILEYLESRILPGLREHLVTDFFVTPQHFADNLNTLHGTGFSIQPTFTQSAYFRFHNKSEDIRNLFFVGAGTHPGAGMPGVLCSAKVLEHILPDRP